MKVYVLYTAYPYEGGHVHGVFSTYEKAKEALNSEGFDFGHEYSSIQELTLDKFEFQQLEI